MSVGEISNQSSDEWAPRIFDLIRQNNGTIDAVLAAPTDDFDALPITLKNDISDLCTELFGNLEQVA